MDTVAGQRIQDGPLGKGWTHNFAASVKTMKRGQNYFPEEKSTKFHLTGNSTAGAGELDVRREEIGKLGVMKQML